MPVSELQSSSSPGRAATLEQCAAFLLEGFVLYALQHSRIVSVVAIATDGPHPLLCLE